MGLNKIIKKQMSSDDLRMVSLSDKVEVRKWAEGYGLPSAPLLDSDSDDMVLKANNDSGSTLIIRDGKLVSGRPWKLKLQSEGNKYGIDKGEWWYKHIPFRLVREKYLGDNIIDYKFHCSYGDVKFCQVIGNRSTETSECLYLPQGTMLPFILDDKFKFKRYKLPEHWEFMKNRAAAMSKDFGYVRVDLYEIDRKVYFGEMTFAPRNGKYKGEGEKKLGRLFK